MTRVGVLLVALGTLLVFGFGLWLVEIGHFGYGAGWVDAALVLLLATVVLGALGGKKPKQARRLAVAESDRAAASPKLRALLDDPLARGLNYLSLLLIVVLMVTKLRRLAGGKDSPRDDTKKDMQTTTTPNAAVDEVVRWRRDQLTESGFSLPLAAEIANDARVDLHALIELVERGCPPDLAARILAPIEEENAA